MYEIHETLSPSYWQTSAGTTSPDRLDDATRRTCEPSRLLNQITFHHYSNRRLPQLGITTFDSYNNLSTARNVE